MLHTQDVHAGNLLVLEDGRVAFIDFGIVGRFSPDTWTGVSRLADGVAEENFKVMAEVRIGWGGIGWDGMEWFEGFH